jgi:D-sedoheptulose 7-phosphate isomerase
MNHWQQNIEEWSELRSALASLDEQITQGAGRLIDALKSGHKVLACGNGGSASQASHLCTELVGRYRRPRRPLNAISLNADGSLLTCIVNDYAAHDLFARQVLGVGAAGDCLVALTTSGRSDNVARALRTAREVGLSTVALLGQSGEARADRPVFGIADVEIVVPCATTARIQEAHLLIIHTWCEMIDDEFVTS